MLLTLQARKNSPLRKDDVERRERFVRAVHKHGELQGFTDAIEELAK